MGHFELYLIMILDGVNHFSFVLSFIFLAATILFFGAFVNCAAEDLSDSAKQAKGLAIKTTIGFIFSALICVLAPNTKQAAVIYILPKVANNEDIQGLGSDLVQLAKQWVEEQVEVSDE